jgi:hypothetical protein
MRPDWYPYLTHAHFCGQSQLGKSKFCELCARELLEAGIPFALFDWHGKTYREFVNYLAYRQPDRPIVLLDPSGSQYITPWNPFALKPGWEPSSHVNRLASLLVKPWGAKNTNELPTYEHMVKMMLTFMTATGEPLHHAARLLQFPKKELREYAVDSVDNDYAKQEWKELQYIHTLKEWKSEVLSTRNRLGRFLSSKSVVRFMGLPGPGLDIQQAMLDGAIILVNLRPSQYLDPESGRVFAALLLSEFIDAAMMNVEHPVPYVLFLDECQEYLTNDATALLDETLKAGLRAVFIHHHMGQFHDNPHLQQSLEMQAQIKVLFGGMPLTEAKIHAEEFWLPEVNQRWIKETFYRTDTRYFEEPYEIHTENTTSSSTEGLVGETETTSSTSGSSASVQFGTRFVPYQEEQVASRSEWSREEKIAILAERFMSLRKQECWIKLPDQEFKYPVPFVTEYLMNPASVREYEKALHANAIPVHEAENILKEAEARFLERGKAYESKGKSRPVKKRPLSPQQ